MVKPALVDCLIGPTASGKSGLALWLAQAAGPRAGGQAVEIVSMDSALIYKAMDIGTAKPTSAERAQTPHHLIDILEPEQVFSVAQFWSRPKAPFRPFVAVATALWLWAAPCFISRRS